MRDIRGYPEPPSVLTGVSRQIEGLKDRLIETIGDRMHKVIYPILDARGLMRLGPETQVDTALNKVSVRSMEV